MGSGEPLSIIDWAQLLGGLAAAVVLGQVGFFALRTGWRWLFRRQRLQHQLQQLACQAQIDHFRHVLGQPARYENRHPKLAGWVEYVFVFDDAYVQAVTDEHGKVQYFAVTTRSKRFQPRLNYVPGQPQEATVVLGRTRFSDLPDQPQGVLAWLGAHRLGYAESYYYGNPGAYQTYVFALNDAGDASGLGNLASLVNPVAFEIDINWFGGPSPPDGISAFLSRTETQIFRADTAMNTYAVVAGHGELQRLEDQGRLNWKLPFGFGPDETQLRPVSMRPQRRRWW